jgi:hypothetical protein
LDWSSGDVITRSVTAGESILVSVAEPDLLARLLSPAGVREVMSPRHSRTSIDTHDHGRL